MSDRVVQSIWDYTVLAYIVIRIDETEPNLHP